MSLERSLRKFEGKRPRRLPRPHVSGSSGKGRVKTKRRSTYRA